MNHEHKDPGSERSRKRWEGESSQAANDTAWRTDAKPRSPKTARCTDAEAPPQLHVRFQNACRLQRASTRHPQPTISSTTAVAATVDCRSRIPLWTIHHLWPRCFLALCYCTLPRCGTQRFATTTVYTVTMQRGPRLRSRSTTILETRVP
jgi:hypothetical protein